MTFNTRRHIRGTLKANGILFIVTAFVLLALASIIQYRYGRNEISEQLQLRAHSELLAKSIAIRNVMKRVEYAVENHVWAAEKALAFPDSMYSVTKQIVERNPDITGSSLSFLPNYYPSEGYWFESYTVRRPNGKTETMQLGSAEHDYTTMEFYKVPIETDSARWTNPYLDSDGARMLLTTYSSPVHDGTGRPVAVLDADLSLEWLDSILSIQYLYPSSYHILVSSTGRLINYPVRERVMHSTLSDIADERNDTTLLNVSKKMLAGESGKAIVRNADGEKYHLFYAPVGDGTGWSLAVASSEEDIFGQFEEMRKNLLLLHLFGLAILIFILVRSIRDIKRLQRVTAERERIGSELKIARDIQMGMLPKGEIPDTAKETLDIAGSVVPAKEVGGDLYDYYVKDDKLYLCIGDVSGKGVPASMLMAVTRSLFRTVSPYTCNAEKIVAYMNSSMTAMDGSNMFVTLFVGVLDLASGKLNYCNAGHDAPILIGGDITKIHVTPNIPIGVMADFKYQGEEIQLPPSSTVFLYTDGLTEAKDALHEEFGDGRMLDALKRIRNEMPDPAPTELLEQMSLEVNRFVKTAEQSDDLTMLALSFKCKSPGKAHGRIVLQNRIEEIPRLNGFIGDFMNEASIAPSEAMEIRLALEEVVANVINYGYPKGQPGEIAVAVSADEKKICLMVSDSGIPFDPTTVPDADITGGVDNREIGGLGIFLARHIMDDILYERKDGKNELTLIKDYNLVVTPTRTT